MERSRSQKVVKVLGILSIIDAVLCLILAIGALLTAFGAGTRDVITDEVATGIGIMIFATIILLVTGIVDLIEGAFCLRAAKDARKAGPLWVVSMIAVILSVLSLITSFREGGQAIASGVATLAINCAIFFLANNIRNQGR